MILTSEKYSNKYARYLLSLIAIIPIILLLFLQPDIGQTLLVLSLWLSLIFVSGINLLFLIPFIIILLPHFLWLVENDFITVTYGLHRTDGAEQVLLDHISHPLIFIGKQAGILIPFF